MACSIIKNKSGVQSVTAPNGAESELYNDLVKLPFVQSELDALSFHSRAEQMGKNLIKDFNGEPVLVFRAMTDNNELGATNKFVYTTSFQDAVNQDVNSNGVEVGFITQNAKQEVLPVSSTPRTFFINTRNAALAMQEGGQIVSQLSNGKSIVVTDSMSSFKPLATYNKADASASYSGFVNSMINEGVVESEKVRLRDIIEPAPISSVPSTAEATTSELEGGESIVTFTVADEVVVQSKTKPYLDGLEISEEELMVEGLEEENLTNLYKLAYALNKKPIYSKGKLSATERKVWEKLERAGVAEKVGSRFVLNKNFNKRPVTKDVDITIEELKKDGTIDVQFNNVVPVYVYKGFPYSSRSALRIAVKADIRANKVSSTTSNKSHVFRLTDAIHEGTIREKANFLFGTDEFLSFFEKDGVAYLMLDDKQLAQMLSPNKIITTPDGPVEVNLEEEQEKGRQGKPLSKVDGLEDALEIRLLQKAAEAEKQAERKEVSTDDYTLVSSLKSFLDRMGVGTITLEEYQKRYEQRFGTPITVAGIADLMNRLVVLSNEADVAALTEEAAHFAVEYFNNQGTIQDMLDNIQDTSAYRINANNYRKIYSKDLSGEALEQKVRREVLGKILAEKIKDNFQDNANNEQERSIFQRLSDLFNQFLDLFSFRRGDAAFFSQFGRVLDDMTLGIKEDTTVFTPRDSTEYYFSALADPETQQLADDFGALVAQLRDTYLNLRGVNTQVSSGTQLAEIMDIANQYRFAEGVTKFLTVVAQDIKNTRGEFERAKRDVNQEAAFNNRTLSAKEESAAIASKISPNNLINMLSMSEGLGRQMDMSKNFITSLEEKGLITKEQAKLVNDIAQEVKDNHNAVRSQMQTVAKSNAKTQVLNRLKEQGAFPEQIKKMEATLDSMSARDMAFVGKWIHTRSDHISNPFLRYGIVAIEEADTLRRQHTEEFFKHFIAMRKKYKTSESEFRDKALNKEFFAAPLDIAAFEDSYKEAKAKIYDKYVKIGTEEGLSRSNAGDAQRLQELENLQTLELQELDKKYFQSKFKEQEGRANTIVNRATANEITNLKTRTPQAQTTIRKLAARKRQVFDKYRDPVTNQYTHNYDTQDRESLRQIKRDQDVARSLYNPITGEPKTGQELATALDIRDYYASYSGGELSEDARRAFLLAREVAKAQLGENSREFKSWESMFTVETYGEEFSQPSEGIEIDQQQLQDSLGPAEYQVLIQKATKEIVTEGMSASEITPSFLYEALRQKKQELLRPYREAALGFEINGDRFEAENIEGRESIVLDKLSVVNDLLSQFRRAKVEQEESEDRGYKLIRIPNKSFIAKYERLSALDEQSGTSQLATWLRNIPTKGLYEGRYPIPTQADHYITYTRMVDIDGFQAEVAKIKQPSFFWQSLTNSEVEVAEEYRFDLEGKIRQPSAWAMKEFKNDKYFETFGIDESNPWGEATQNKKVFAEMRFYQDYKYNVDRFQGIKNAYWLRPQVRKEGFEQVESLMEGALTFDSSKIQGVVKNWLHDKLVIDATDVEFGNSIIIDEQGNKKSYRGAGGLKSVPRYFHMRKDPNVLTEDMGLAMGQYVSMGYNYKFKTQALLDLKIFESAIAASQYKQGKHIISGENSRFAETLQEFINRDVFGNSYRTVWNKLDQTAETPVTVKVGGKEVTIIPEGTSTMKASLATGRYIKSLRMAANAVVPLKSYLAGLYSTRQIASEGLYFTEKNINRARNKYMFTGQNVKELFESTTGKMIPSTRIAKLMQYVGLDRDINNMFRGSGVNRARRAARGTSLGSITGFRVASKIQTMFGAAAFLDNLRLYDGSFYTFVQFYERMESEGNSRAEINAAWRELSDNTFDSYLIEEETRLTLDKQRLIDEGFEGNFDTLRTRATEGANVAKQRIDMSLNGDNEALVNSFPILGQFLLMFKDYFYIGSGNRYKRAGYDPILGVETEGVKQTAGFLRATGVLAGSGAERSRTERWKDYLNLTTGMALSMIPLASRLNLLNNFIDSRFDSLSEAKKASIRRQMFDYRTSLLAMVGLTLTYMSALGDDGEEDESAWKEFAAYVLQGVYTEILSSTSTAISLPGRIADLGNVTGGLTGLQEYLDVFGYIVDPSTSEEREDNLFLFDDTSLKDLEAWIPVWSQMRKWKGFITGGEFEYGDAGAIRTKSSYKRYRRYDDPTTRYLYKLAKYRDAQSAGDIGGGPVSAGDSESSGDIGGGPVSVEE